MLTILSLAIVAGVACGLAEVRLWALVPVAIVFSIVAIVIGSSLGLNYSQVTLALLAALMAMEAAYLIGVAVVEETAQHKFSEILHAKQERLHRMQLAIGAELRVYFAPPEDLPQQLSARLEILASR
jgi:hypothetical protein